MGHDIFRYKYLPFDKGSLCVLSEGTIKFTRPADFNDPFDCVAEFDSDKYKNYTLQIARELFSPAQRIQYKRKIKKCSERASITPELNSEFTQNLGICSLSRDPLNLLMWAHYAENHTGFVVEFSIPQSAITTEKEVDKYMFDWLTPLEVEYSIDKPIINPFDDDKTNMKKHFLVKSVDWAYEKEERSIDYKRGHGVHPYDRKQILKSVIAGMRIDESSFKQLREVIDKLNTELGTNVSLHRAEPVKGAFALCVPDRDDLQIKRRT